MAKIIRIIKRRLFSQALDNQALQQTFDSIFVSFCFTVHQHDRSPTLSKGIVRVKV